MSGLAWPDHLFTLEDWDALPEDDHRRVEVVEGNLLVSPRPRPLHQRAVNRLGHSLDRQLPSELCAADEVEVIIEETPLTVRSPDVIVTSTKLFDENPPRFRAADVRLVVEVLSEGSMRNDRVMKFAEYAEAGIPQYWIIDLKPPISMIAYRLVDGEYEVFGEHTGLVVLEVDGAPVRLDLSRLVVRDV